MYACIIIIYKTYLFLKMLSQKKLQKYLKWSFLIYKQLQIKIKKSCNIVYNIIKLCKKVKNNQIIPKIYPLIQNPKFQVTQEVQKTRHHQEVRHQKDSKFAIKVLLNYQLLNLRIIIHKC